MPLLAVLRRGSKLVSQSGSEVRCGCSTARSWRNGTAWHARFHDTQTWQLRLSAGRHDGDTKRRDATCHGMSWTVSLVSALYSMARRSFTLTRDFRLMSGLLAFAFIGISYRHRGPWEGQNVFCCFTCATPPRWIHYIEASACLIEKTCQGTFMAEVLLVQSIYTS